ncbi:hypothetical protein [Pseudomonas sp. GL-B-16]|uniref:hypothetical protein n=1 Tax=Pseudomonas sp. GL-B-16 TaxID=2832373 RepID=UPI001CBF753E|nr:hypothetical protein [Pseudomonas sp. GL-B-16]
MQVLTIDEPEDDDLSSLSSVPDTDGENSDFAYEGVGETAAGARHAMARASANRGRSAEEIIAQFPPGIWERPQAAAKAPGLPVGVVRTSSRFMASSKQDGKYKGLGSFSITAYRDEIMAKALAIATRLDAEVREGSGRRQDAAVIAGFAPELWVRAQEAAKAPGLPTGVSRFGNKVVARIKINKVVKMLGSFSITADRDEVTAKALAIAARWTAEQDHEQE